MKPADEKRIAAKLAKIMTLMCVRNTSIEAIHAGVTPITKTGDYSDVVVLDAEGRKSLGRKSRISTTMLCAI